VRLGYRHVKPERQGCEERGPEAINRVQLATLGPRAHLGNFLALAPRLAMDKQLSPPLRVQAVSSRPVKTWSAIAQLDTFLDNCTARSGHDGNAAVRAQMQRLLESLKDEEAQARKREKQKGRA
jgi:hypothetical protein